MNKLEIKEIQRRGVSYFSFTFKWLKYFLKESHLVDNNHLRAILFLKNSPKYKNQTEGIPNHFNHLYLEYSLRLLYFLILPHAIVQNIISHTQYTSYYSAHICIIKTETPVTNTLRK